MAAPPACHIVVVVRVLAGDPAPVVGAGRTEKASVAVAHMGRFAGQTGAALLVACTAAVVAVLGAGALFVTHCLHATALRHQARRHAVTIQSAAVPAVVDALGGVRADRRSTCAPDWRGIGVAAVAVVAGGSGIGVGADVGTHGVHAARCHAAAELTDYGTAAAGRHPVAAMLTARAPPEGAAAVLHHAVLTAATHAASRSAGAGAWAVLPPARSLRVAGASSPAEGEAVLRGHLAIRPRHRTSQ